MRHVFLLIGILDLMTGASSLVVVALAARRSRDKRLALYSLAMAALQALVSLFLANFYLRRFMGFPLHDGLVVEAPALIAAIAMASLALSACLWILATGDFPWPKPALPLSLAIIAAVYTAGSFLLGPLPMAGIVTGACLAASGASVIFFRRKPSPAPFDALKKILPAYAIVTLAVTALEALGLLKFFIKEGLTTLPFCHAAWSIVNILVFVPIPNARANEVGNAERTVSAFAREWGLGPREADVLRGIHEGLANKAIARKTGLKTKTVENYAYRLYKKLGVTSRFELMRIINPRDATETRLQREKERKG